jgi:hypothetical protein
MKPSGPTSPPQETAVSCQMDHLNLVHACFFQFIVQFSIRAHAEYSTIAAQ